jgi:hypothetical protein
VSESKAAMRIRNENLEAEVAKAEWHLVFLLQTLMNILTEHHPAVTVNLDGHEFPERIWRQVSV